MLYIKTSAKGLAVVIFVLLSPFLLADNLKPLSFAAQPLIPANLLEQRYAPLIKMMSEDLQRPVQFRTRGNWRSYIKAVESGAFDLAVVNPMDYFKIRESVDYQVIVSRKPIFADFTTISPEISSLGDLVGKRVGMPPLATAATQAALITLMQRSLFPDQIESHVFTDHLGCKQALIAGRVDVCITSQTNKSFFLTSADEMVRSIGSSIVVPGSALMLHNRHADLSEKLAKWFLSLNETKQGRDALQESYLEELVPVSVSRYSEWLAKNGEDLKKLQDIIGKKQ